MLLVTGYWSLEELLLQITNAEDAFQHNYLNKTHPALWETDSVSPVASSPAKVFRSIFKAYSDGMPGFYAVYKTRMFFHLAIFQALKEAGIEIPYPIQDLNVNILDKKETEK